VDVWVRSDGALRRARCDADGCAAPETVVDGDVEAFDVAGIGADTLAAWTSDADDGPVWVTRVPADGGEPVTVVPAACWTDPRDGLCGAPRLASDGRTAMLVARDGTDLRVVRTTDGVRWSALRGLEQP
jgi:hypothetical protein